MSSLKYRSITVEIDKIKEDINAVNELKQLEMSTLEEDKRTIRNILKTSFGKTDSLITLELSELAKKKVQIRDRIEEFYKVHEKPRPITEILETIITDMDK